MKLPKLKKFQKVEVKWVDVAQAKGTWYDLSEYEEWITTGDEYRQIGYFVEYRNGLIVLCDGHSDVENGETMAVDQICGLNVIPIGCIKKITKLK